jgi:folate-binding Fe-S cluster repair protein YgfZ
MIAILDVENILPETGDFKQLSSEEYTIRRILHGIPEGVQDIWPETSLPLESNFDYMNGGEYITHYVLLSLLLI